MSPTRKEYLAEKTYQRQKADCISLSLPPPDTSTYEDRTVKSSAVSKETNSNSGDS